MYLLDTNVISELRKRERANPGVIRFFQQLATSDAKSFLSVISVGELRRGVELIRHRGDIVQADSLNDWLNRLVTDYHDYILDFGLEESQLWGYLRVPHPENALDKQIAATALVYDLTLVTRNTSDFFNTGAKLLDPFSK